MSTDILKEIKTRKEFAESRLDYHPTMFTGGKAYWEFLQRYWKYKQSYFEYLLEQHERLEKLINPLLRPEPPCQL